LEENLLFTNAIYSLQTPGMVGWTVPA